MPPFGLLSGIHAVASGDRARLGRSHPAVTPIREANGQSAAQFTIERLANPVRPEFNHNV